MTRRRFILPAVLLTLAAPPASAQIWTDLAGDGNWNNASNWVPSGVPNSAGAAPMFTNEGGSAINISSSVQVGSLNFTGVGAASFTLASSPGQTLSGLTAINLLNPSGYDTGTQTINLAYQAGGNLLFGSGGPLTITNNIGINVGLVIGPNTVIGTTGNGGVVFTGTGITTLSGSFASGSNEVRGGLTQAGIGVLDFSGDGTQLGGGLTLNGGTLILDYTTNAATKGSGSLTLLGGQLTMTVNAAAVTQAVSGTNLAAGHTEISASANAAGTNVTLNMGAITRSPGATVDFTSIGPAFVGQTSSGNANGLLGTGPAYATISGLTWAWNNQGYINGLGPSDYGADTYSPGTNTDYVTQVTNLTANTTTNSIRFNVGTANYLQMLNNATLTLQSGGILMTPNSGPVTIVGASGGETLIAGGAGELLVHQYNPSNLTIYTNIVAYGGLTKTGIGTLVLGGANSLGTINVNQGSLTVLQPAAVNSAYSINLNDNSLNEDQFLTVQLGNGVNGTVSPNIRLGSSYYASVVTAGTSLNSTVTLSGVISSAPGAAAPLVFGFQQDVSSGINLTGNNAFLGAVFLDGGTLGINSNASLGNAANALTLLVGSSTAGGLAFLNSGVNLARPVQFLGGYPTRIVSNASDVNTISGVISEINGSARLYKAGTGTLILSGPNTYSGGTEIDNGTLSIAVDANLGAVGTSVAVNAGATFAMSANYTMTRPLLLGPTSSSGPNGPANVYVPAGMIFTPTGGVNDNVGAGTLGLTGPGTVILNTPNTYSGGTSVQEGTLLVGMDNALGAAAAPVTIGPLGTLTYTASASTNRTVTMNGGTLSVAAGQTLTLNGATIGGGFMRGAGTYALTGGSALIGVSTFNTTVLNQTGPASFTNVSNGGTLTVNAGPAAPAMFNGFINQGSGSITVGATSVVNAADFQTYGVLTLNPAVVGSGTFTELINTGTSPMYFNGGGRTFIGTAATATVNGQPTFVAGIDLHGNNAVVAGGLFVNNGFVVDSSSAGTATVVADFGSLVKGAGYYQNTVITQNGGKFQAGNSPGSAAFGNFVFGPGGVSSYVFAIDDATGTAGPSPDTLGHVSGWGLVKTIQHATGSVTGSGNFTWTAAPADPLMVALDTLINPTTVGMDVAGPMADFDPSQSYSWPAVKWTGTYSGPTDAATLTADTAFDASGIVNAINGTFGWSLDSADHTLSLTYSPTPVPEPGTPALVGLAAAGLACWRRRTQPISGEHRGPA